MIVTFRGEQQSYSIRLLKAHQGCKDRVAKITLPKDHYAGQTISLMVELRREKTLMLPGI